MKRRFQHAGQLRLRSLHRTTIDIINLSSIARCGLIPVKTGIQSF